MPERFNKKNIKSKNKKVKKIVDTMDFTEEELESIRSLVKFGIFIAVLIVFYIGMWYYKNVIDTPENRFLRGTRYAYRLIQESMSEYYKKEGYVFSAKKQDDSAFCKEIANQYSNGQDINCYNSNPSVPVKNFTFDKTKIAVYGLEKPTRKFNKKKTVVKDILIDIDGDEGENKIGIDRIPVRINLTGPLTGQLSPVNCNGDDEKRYKYKKSDHCNNSQDDFLANTNPLSFNIIQIGITDNKIHTLVKSTSLLNADCMVYDGNTVAGKDYCKDQGIEPLDKCRDINEYPCLIEIAR